MCQVISLLVVTIMVVGNLFTCLNQHASHYNWDSYTDNEKWFQCKESAYNNDLYSTLPYTNYGNATYGYCEYLNKDRYSLPRLSRGGKNKYYKIKSVVTKDRTNIIQTTSINHNNLKQVTCNNQDNGCQFNSNFCLINAHSVRNKVELIKDYI